MSVERRLAQLERTQSGDGGAGVWGVCRVDHATGSGPDVVTVGPTGEQLTKAAFHARYPRGLLILRSQFGSDEAQGCPGSSTPTPPASALTL
jgi:hypothetical protein